MYWIAFTLGLLGSLHCIGMCGPLAIAGLSNINKSAAKLRQTLLYNFGRTTSYMAIGLVFGLLGNSIAFAGFQRVLSVSLGVVLVFLFLFSISPERMTDSIPLLRNWYRFIVNKISTLLRQKDGVNGFAFGVANGLLPCGLVYLAIAGALSLGNITESLVFMLLFGVGTFPAMILVIFMTDVISVKNRKIISNMYPAISLMLGIYLIYRGFVTNLPLEIHFLESLKDPIMCH